MGESAQRGCFQLGFCQLFLGSSLCCTFFDRVLLFFFCGCRGWFDLGEDAVPGFLLVSSS